MKYPEARKLFAKSWTIPYGWHFCSFHKDIELAAEPCPEAVKNGEVRHLRAMNWKPADPGAFQHLLQEASERLHLELLELESTPPEDRQPLEKALASLT
jgi:hypothetical protein